MFLNFHVWQASTALTLVQPTLRSLLPFTHRSTKATHPPSILSVVNKLTMLIVHQSGLLGAFMLSLAPTAAVCQIHHHTVTRKPAAPRPKKRHAYKRQSAYSDSFELRATTPDILILEADSSAPSATATSDSSGRHSNRDRPSPAGKRRVESESTDLTTLTSSSRSTSRSRSKSGAGADEMLKGLEVFTIEAHNDLPRPEAAPRQTSFPDSGFNAASSTTDAALRRTASASSLPERATTSHCFNVRSKSFAKSVTSASLRTTDHAER